MNMPVKERLLDLISYLNHGLVERDSTLKAALLAVLAGENLLLVGPSGTAKSLIARKVAECLEHDGSGDHADGYFEYLLTKFSTPEEIFGPLSISELKADRFKRNTAGYLPSVRMAFLDEIFKASSSILNALLTILNERLYHNGAEAQKVPLQALIAASNELPTGQEELDALYDRFLVRSFVDYVSEDNLPHLLDKPGPAPTITPFSAADLDTIRQAAEAVTLPTEIVSAIQKIWAGHKQMFKEDRRENLSDRRLRKVVRLLCISAATNGRQEVDLSDLLLLKDCLWNHPDNALKVRQLVMATLRAFSHPVQLSDSEQLATRETPAQQEEMAVSKSVAKMGAVVKGYKGCGTEHDPILIENIHDLAGLECPEVGQQGYYFRQTADIDCNKLTTWLTIDFHGHYDGGGYAISYKPKDFLCLFDRVQNKSQLSNLRLAGIGLARIITSTEIAACASDKQLIVSASDSNISYSQSGSCLMRDAVKCNLTYCQSGSYLIGGSIEQSSISYCQAGQCLIFAAAKNCKIQDCYAQVRKRFSSGIGTVRAGGVAKELTESSVVERCLVAGGGSGREASLHFSGIAEKCFTSTIRQCAFGAFKAGRSVYQHEINRIAKEINSDAKLENNVALDCHAGKSDPNGLDGKSLSAALFTQHYFEHTLDWDFKNVWQWNDAENQPELRVVGVDAEKSQHLKAVSGDMGDLLTQQLTANLWL